MIVSVVLEHHFEQTPDGNLWTQVAFPYRFWRRYIEVFDGVRIVARVRGVASPPPNYLQANGPGVTVAAIPDYLGPWQYIRKAHAVRAALDGAVGPKDAVIMRVHSQLANCLFPKLLRDSHPYALEVVGDPWDVFSPGAIRHPARPFFRRYFARNLRSQCLCACAVAYVTEFALQSRYPVGDQVFTRNYSSIELPISRIKTMSVGVSDVELPNDWIGSTRRKNVQCDEIRLIFVGAISHLYKAPDVLLRAMAKCVRDGLNLKLTVIGDGALRPKLEQLAATLGLRERVDFRGQVTAGSAVCEELDRADLFVLPSRQEGLPRAMIEAMARGLPCIGSTIGGIPELLAPEDMTPPNNVLALAAKIREVVSDPCRMLKMSARNVNRAKEYSDESLLPRRLAFYRFVRERTEAWIRSNRVPEADFMVESASHRAA